MELSKYCDEKERQWDKEEQEKTDKLIRYINQHIDKNVYEIAKTNNSTEIFKKLNLWLFHFYPKEFLDALKHIDFDYRRYQKSLIYSFILGIMRNKSNTDLFYDVIKNANIVKQITVDKDNNYRIITNDFGNIQFIKAEEKLKNDIETMQYIEKLGENMKDGCHEISFYLIKKYTDFKAVTGICKKGLGKKYYHSFVIDDMNHVIDLTANLIMPREIYELLQDVDELNCIDYHQYLEEANASIQFDKSKTLYELLRNALYKQYMGEN